jgi:hypothetical protein
MTTIQMITKQAFTKFLAEFDDFCEEIFFVEVLLAHEIFDVLN